MALHATAITASAWTQIAPEHNEYWGAVGSDLLVSSTASASPLGGVIIKRGGEPFLARGGNTYYVRAVAGTSSLNRDAGLLPGLGGLTKTIRGAAASALNTDLLTGTENGYIDVSAYSSASIQLIGSAGITAGAVTFEASNDGLNWQLALSSTTASTGLASAVTVSASSAIVYHFPVTFKYLRARISTAFTGGTVSAVTMLSQRPFAALPIQNPANNDNVWWQETGTAQAGGVTVTGTARDAGTTAGVAHRYSFFVAFAIADVAGTMRIEGSVDGSTWARATVDTAVAANTPVFLKVSTVFRYFRVVYINGASAQTMFRLNTALTAS